MDCIQPKSAHRFGQVPLAVLSDSRLSETDKTVYAVLAAHRNAKHGKAWPKRKTIGRIAGIHPDSVSRSTARLVECGYLTKTDGRGRGCTTFYRFPLEDQRQAQRQDSQAQTQSQAKPEPKPRAPRKPRPEREAESQKPDRPDSFCAPTPYRGTEMLTQEFTPLPPSLPEAQAEPEAARGKDLVLEIPNEEPATAIEQAAPATVEAIGKPEQPATIADQPTTNPEAPKAPAEAPQAAPSAETPPTQPTPRLTYPSGLQPKIRAIIARSLCGLPFDDAQMLLDELAGNMRRHEVHNPVGYMRKLLNLYRAGKLTPELADLEQHRRQHIQANERSRQIAEQRHLEALARGQLPTASVPAHRATSEPPPGFFEAARKAARGSHSPDESAHWGTTYREMRGIVEPPPPPPPPPDSLAAFEQFKRDVAPLRARMTSTTTCPAPEPTQAQALSQSAEFAQFKDEMARILASKGIPL